jgi:choline dehydrogenase
MPSWDYVVVGAGSAGCVIAARLSEDPSVRVLLLEAGDRDSAREIAVPAAFSTLFRSRWDWDLATEPEPGCQDREMYWPRGKVLGGCSSTNAMIYIRGAQADYDGWRDAGCDGWGFDDVLPYFRRSEDNARGASPWHGADGPLRVEDLRCPSPLSADFVDAGVEAGLLRNDDFNGERQDGVGMYQVTQKRGARWSTASAFLRPALRRPNLEIRTLAHATRVILEGGRASGVEADFGGPRQVFRAEREVVLCAGAVGTPHLLQLSGIGAADELRSRGVDVVVDAPRVGAGLRDHVAAGVGMRTREPVSYFGADTAKRPVLQYLLRRSGPFSSNVAEAGGFLRTDDGLAAPDLQLVFVPGIFIDHGFVPAPGHGFTVGVTLLTPDSAGSVGLRSADPLAKPVLRAGYYAESSDVDRMVAGLERCLEIAAASPLARHVSSRLLPEEVDAEGLRAHLRQHSQTLYHPTSTCAMGADETAVLDPQLRVRGVEGLRVADASAFPTVPRGNTNAPVIMLAEKATDLLRGAGVPRQAQSSSQARSSVSATDGSSPSSASASLTTR